MAQKIPLTNDSRQFLVTRLDSTWLGIRVYYQPLDGGWYISLESEDGPLARGRKLVPFGMPLKGLVLPIGGELFVAGGMEGLGPVPWTPEGGHSLLYLTRGEVEGYGL